MFSVIASNCVIHTVLGTQQKAFVSALMPLHQDVTKYKMYEQEMHQGVEYNYQVTKINLPLKGWIINLLFYFRSRNHPFKRI